MAFLSRQTIGLDIGTRTVKAVELKKKGKKIELEKCGVAEIYPSGDKPTQPDQQRKAVVDAIKRALANAKITATGSVSAVAGESIIVRYIQLPEMPEDELKNALRWEAEEYIPFRIDDVNIDSAIIGHSGSGDLRRMDVLLVCARKELINDHINLIREAGLNPVVVDVDSFAFQNCYELNYDTAPSDVVGLVNIGGDITSISVYSGGTPKFSRDISIGGNTITASLQQRLEVSFSEAESLKIEMGAPQSAAGGAQVDKNADAANIMDTIRSTVEAMTSGESGKGAQASRAIQNSLNSLIGEIRRSIQFFENQSRGLKVNRLVLGGGSSNLKGLDAFVQKELDLPVEIIDPFLRIPITGKDVDTAYIRDNKNMLSVAIGLALRKVVD